MKTQPKDKKNKVTSTGFVMLIFVFLMGCAGTGKMSPFQMDERISTTSRQALDEMKDFPIDPKNPLNIESHLP